MSSQARRAGRGARQGAPGGGAEQPDPDDQPRASSSEGRATEHLGGGAEQKQGAPGRGRQADSPPPSMRRRPGPGRVNITDRSGQTGAVRYRYTGLVWPETGPNKLNSNLNSKAAVQLVRNGLPAGFPVGLTGNRPNSIFFGLNSNARKVY